MLISSASHFGDKCYAMYFMALFIKITDKGYSLKCLTYVHDLARLFSLFLFLISSNITLLFLCWFCHDVCSDRVLDRFIVSIWLTSHSKHSAIVVHFDWKLGGMSSWARSLGNLHSPSSGVASVGLSLCVVLCGNEGYTGTQIQFNSFTVNKIQWAPCLSVQLKGRKNTHKPLRKAYATC